MPGAMRIFFLIFVALILLAQIFSDALTGRSENQRLSCQRQLRCLKLDGRCEVECPSFEVKIGDCRAELTTFCCKKRKNH
ncbi:PREDICTED: beta-defensin 107A-like [Ceratotherium simum simum]|uniref:Beta-defensin n=1 Tax=Ceratotherium simum simum TaxID=73337 RepID=A0ABM1DGF5_CERSS|nr:PREDICTED: beta-defensin 107A-like [Ceratotherium simum simum]